MLSPICNWNCTEYTTTNNNVGRLQVFYSHWREGAFFKVLKDPQSKSNNHNKNTLSNSSSQCLPSLAHGQRAGGDSTTTTTTTTTSPWDPLQQHQGFVQATGCASSKSCRWSTAPQQQQQHQLLTPSNSCNDLQFARNTTCRSCHRSKTAATTTTTITATAGHRTSTSSHGLRDGDWICPSYVSHKHSNWFLLCAHRCSPAHQQAAAATTNLLATRDADAATMHAQLVPALALVLALAVAQALVHWRHTIALRPRRQVQRHRRPRGPRRARRTRSAAMASFASALHALTATTCSLLPAPCVATCSLPPPAVAK